MLADDLESGEDIDAGQQAAFVQNPAQHLPNAPNIMFPNAPNAAMVGGARVGEEVDEYGLPLNA
jgi:hypothetical protein